MNITILFELLWTFFKIGLFTIGGGYAMIPMIKSEVITKGWLTDVELVNFLAISESTPGPFAVNLATFVGYSQGGFLGAFATTLGVVLPSFIIILIISKIINKFLHNKYIAYALQGVRPVVVGLILSVAFSLIFVAISGVDILEISNFKWVSFSYSSLIIMIIVFILSRFKKTNSPILLIAISAVLGILMFGIFDFI